MQSHQEPLPLHTLIRNIARKDEVSFKALYDEMVPPLTRYLSSKFGRKLPRETLEDIVQYTFTQVWFKAGTYRGKHTNSSAKSWIFKIAYHRGIKIINTMRRMQISTLTDQQLPDDEEANTSILEYQHPSSDNTEEQALTTLLTQQVVKICQDLSKRDQEILEKRFNQEQTYGQIAKEYGLSTPRIKQIIDHILTVIFRSL